MCLTVENQQVEVLRHNAGCITTGGKPCSTAATRDFVRCDCT